MRLGWNTAVLSLLTGMKALVGSWFGRVGTLFPSHSHGSCQTNRSALGTPSSEPIVAMKVGGRLAPHIRTQGRWFLTRLDAMAGCAPRVDTQTRAPGRSSVRTKPSPNANARSPMRVPPDFSRIVRIRFSGVPPFRRAASATAIRPPKPGRNRRRWPWRQARVDPRQVADYRPTRSTRLDARVA